ncbi:hypothetical protein GCM10020219_097140 [Nonomuraea dietziae]
MDRWKPITLIGGLLALTMSLATPAAANSNPTAYNTKTQYLTNSPIDSMPGSCVQRRVYLASGHYNWALIMNKAVDPRRSNFWVGAGWYSWADCLDPISGGQYLHTSTLDPDNANWQTVAVSDKWFLGKSGNTSWGSYLDPQ